MYSSEGSLFSKQKLKLSFTKGHSISLAKGLQQDRFLPSCREKQLNPFLYRQCQCHFTDKNIVQTGEECTLALVQISGGEVPGSAIFFDG